MIDVESQVFQKCADAFRAAYPNGFIAGEYVPQPPKFPAVLVVEMDNTVYQRGVDSGATENYASVMYQVDVYSNLNKGKKAQAKAIIALIDEQFAQMGFVRTYLNPVQNFNDATIYRMTGRYQAVVSKDQTIYGR
jgi:hypothetical protein